MSASSTSDAKEPKDNQERRLRLKRAAIVLAGELAAYGMRADLGKTTPLRSLVEVRQERRVRQDVIVTIEDAAPVYTVAGESNRVFFDVVAVREYVRASPERWRLWWQLSATGVAWVLVAIGWAIIRGGAPWYLLVALTVSGTVLTLAGSVVARGALRSRRRRRAVRRLSGHR